ncbi:MAG: hypothetical protein IKK46_09905 [Clostridia bacterium]|nr:hypothetical protein [Clostridia bacterium]
MLEKINSIVKKVEYSLNNLTELQSELKNYQYILLIKTDGVELVLSSEVPDLTNIKDLRAFSESKELHLVKQGESLVGRVRDDSQGETCEVYDEIQLMWGKATKTENGVTEFFEDRGIKLQLPVTVSEGGRVALKIRSYLKAEKFEFTDFRIVSIETNLGEVEEYGLSR